jgi:Flp pilus assembly protein TadD
LPRALGHGVGIGARKAAVRLGQLDVVVAFRDHSAAFAEHALELARTAYRDRPSIEGDDVLAWALARNGRCHEALVWSKRSLRLGTQDALKFFHRGAIERCLGRTDDARSWLHRALALNPHFSVLWVPVARRWLR